MQIYEERQRLNLPQNIWSKAISVNDFPYSCIGE